jgi:uncharacterized protein YqgV (UPF0045/DUF77 family)
MTHAEIKVESFGGTSGTEFIAASLNVLGGEPGLTYEVKPLLTTIHGEKDNVLAAARHIEEAFAQTGAVDYLISVKVSEGE